MRRAEIIERLTKPQRDLLERIGSTSGVIDITDETLVRRLIERGLVFKFYETTNGSPTLSPVWTITEAGRRALEAKETGNG